MKILIVNGQNHKGNTWNIGSRLVEKISCPKEITEFFLPKDLKEFCTGCCACLKDAAKCPYWDKKQPFFKAMDEADLIILTSPNYCMMPSAAMKSFLDLFFTNWMSHKPLESMFSKKAVVICTAAGSGAAKSAKLIGGNLANWGIPQITIFGINVNAFNWEQTPPKKQAKILKFVNKTARILSKEKPARVTLKTKFLFWMFGGMQKANFGAAPEEKEYWQNKGWLSGVKPWKK